MTLTNAVHVLVILIIAGISVSCNSDTGSLQKFKPGDILFQQSESPQAQAIKLATHSQYSHTGVILTHNHQLMVFEAIGPVKFTPVVEWISRGRNKKYVNLRLANSNGNLLNSRLTGRMDSVAKVYTGKPYDFSFGWSDDEMYCSELVWKIYKYGAGIELCPLKRFRDYDFSDPLVKEKLKERFGNKIPLNEKIVSPEDIFESRLLKRVQ